MRIRLPRANAGGWGRDDPRRTRTGAAWVRATLFALVLLILLIFVLENGDSVDVAFFGILLIAIPGPGRILQLRSRLRDQETSTARAARPARATP